MKAPKRMHKGGEPGTVNWRAVAKVVALVVWLTIPAFLGKPMFPLNYAIEYVDDVTDFMANNTTWWALSEQGRIFYVMFPIPWLVCGAAWYEIWFRTRRKRLIVNGQPEGVVLLILGDPERKEGHLYDLACILNKFRHIRIADFPRPLTRDEHPPNITIYYRRSILTSPLSWPKISTTTNHIVYGFHTVWLEGKYRVRVRDRRRPVLDYEVLFDTPPYNVENLDLNEFTKDHRSTQTTIMRDNYRMTVSEPGTAKTLVRSSMMTVADDTRNDYLDQLPSDVRNQILLEAAQEEGYLDGQAPDGQ